MIRSSLLSSLPGVIHGFSTRDEAAPPPPPAPSRPEDAAELLAGLGLPGVRVAMLSQVHGALALVADPEGPLWPVGDADALVSTTPGLVVYVRAADCVPILLAGAGGVAAIHAGWRGTARAVARAGLELLLAQTGLRAGDVRAAIGPAVGPCCYEVGPEVVAGLQAVAPREVFLVDRGGPRPHVDLQAANRWLLQQAGVAEVQTLPLCTCCDPRFFSYRREQGAAGRQAALVGLRP